MNENEWLADRFEKHRGHLRAVAYRMLGSLTEADAAVQDTWLRIRLRRGVPILPVLLQRHIEQVVIVVDPDVLACQRFAKTAKSNPCNESVPRGFDQANRDAQWACSLSSSAGHC